MKLAYLLGNKKEGIFLKFVREKELSAEIINGSTQMKKKVNKIMKYAQIRNMDISNGIGIGVSIFTSVHIVAKNVTIQNYGILIAENHLLMKPIVRY